MNGPTQLRRIAIAALLGLNAILFATLIPASGAAHDQNEFYSVKWPNNAEPRYKIDNAIPTGWRDEITTSFNKWSNRASGRAPDFNYQGVDDIGAPYSPCLGVNGVHYRDINADLANAPMGILGYTPGCRNTRTGDYHGFSMVIDRDPRGNWVTGDGDVGSNEFDVQSVVTHEVGHATAFYDHFDADAYCGGAETQTMCRYYPEAFRRAWRTLEAHDLHTLENAYHYVQP
jgi:hypothetical protein